MVNVGIHTVHVEFVAVDGRVIPVDTPNVLGERAEPVIGGLFAQTGGHEGGTAVFVRGDERLPETGGGRGVNA